METLVEIWGQLNNMYQSIFVLIAGLVIYALCRIAVKLRAISSNRNTVAGCYC